MALDVGGSGNLMNDWFHVAEIKPPIDVKVLACNKDYQDMWVAIIYKQNPEYFKPTICTCCEMEAHDFKVTHWKYLPKMPHD